MTTLKTKSQKIRELVAADQWEEALRIIKGMQLAKDDPDRVTFSRAWEALVRPDFCRQVKMDPGQLIREGRAALERRFREEPEPQ